MKRQSTLLQFLDEQRTKVCRSQKYVLLSECDIDGLDTGHLYCFDVHTLNTQTCARAHTHKHQTWKGHRKEP